MSAVGGDVSTIAAHAGLRLPVRTHPLQAFVTNGYAQGLGPIVSSTDLLCYVSQTARGQMLIGHEFERESSYSRQSSFQFLQSCSLKMAFLLPFVRNLKILRQWTGRCDISADFSPIMGFTGVDGLVITTGWGTWGFKGIPAGGEQMAAADRHGSHPRPHRPVRAVAIRGRPSDGRPRLDGNTLMLTIVCPNCGPRPVEEFRFGGELPRASGRPHRASSTATSIVCGCSPTSTACRSSGGSTRPGCHRWHTGAPRHQRSTASSTEPSTSGSVLVLQAPQLVDRDVAAHRVTGSTSSNGGSVTSQTPWMTRGQRGVEHATRRRVGRRRDLAIEADTRRRLAVDAGDGRQQCLGVRVVGPVEHVVGGPHLLDAPEVHHRDAVGEVAHHAHVVGDEDVAGLLLGLQVGQQVEDRRLHRDIERAGRLVAHHDARIAGEGAGDGDTLLQPARELARLEIEVTRRQAQVRGERLDPLVGRRRP